MVVTRADVDVASCDRNIIFVSVSLLTATLATLQSPGTLKACAKERATGAQPGCYVVLYCTPYCMGNWLNARAVLGLNEA